MMPSNGRGNQHLIKPFSPSPYPLYGMYAWSLASPIAEVNLAIVADGFQNVLGTRWPRQAMELILPTGCENVMDGVARPIWKTIPAGLLFFYTFFFLFFF